MVLPWSRALPVLILSASLATACSDSDSVSITAPGQITSADFVTAEPMVLTPEFLASPACSGQSAFRTRVIIVVGGSEDLILRRLRFSFVDRFGRNAVPTVLSSSSASATPLPSSSPIPLPGPTSIPTGSAVATPVSSAVTLDALISGGSRRSLPFFLEFGCHVPAVGTLTVSVEATNRQGRPRTSHLTLPMGS